MTTKFIYFIIKAICWVGHFLSHFKLLQSFPSNKNYRKSGVYQCSPQQNSKNKEKESIIWPANCIMWCMMIGLVPHF